MFSPEGRWSYRVFGSGTCFSRLETIEGRSKRCKHDFVPVYTDFKCEIMWGGYIEEWKRTGNNTKFFDRILEELKASFEHSGLTITGRPINVGAHFFPSAWYFGKQCCIVAPHFYSKVFFFLFYFICNVAIMFM